ncbi:hypothetical protein FB554_1077 [Barrientosiimonas humi]|uniref:DUF456 domain-containing protein n=1 Tax=Barrientosiimonas humi TaxID=999931 RepID=A0A542XB09_9MICO|nr:DUF456 domain-containing protein [Barrientosiimonas humi]TQL32944.1 hypothetical protein FB554_1077 [Barrientosiimonas humi]CAG7572934.1 hypothetical protein BH39T_PBIAJDOK_01558 [Barrientosiimonas humi]
MEPVSVLAALLIAVGIVGLVIPILPGLIITLLGVGIWALERQDTAGWVVLGICTLIAAVGWMVQYAVPGRRMKAAGVPTPVLLVGAVAGVIGFFVIPVVGLFVGFVLGVLVVENARLRSWSAAWRQTKIALRGVIMSIGIELAAAVLVAVTWVIGLLVTR